MGPLANGITQEIHAPVTEHMRSAADNADAIVRPPRMVRHSQEGVTRVDSLVLFEKPVEGIIRRQIDDAIRRIDSEPDSSMRTLDEEAFASQVFSQFALDLPQS